LRKIILCFMALILVLLAACGEKTVSMKDRIEAGEDIHIGFSLETVSNPFFFAQTEYLRGAFDAVGVRLDYTVSEGDDLVMSEQISAFAASGAEMIICAPPHEDAVARALVEASDKGVSIVLMDRRPDYSDRLTGGGTYVDWYEAGREMAKMASAWVSEKYPNAGPGSIHAANFMSDQQDIYIAQNAGLAQALSEDPRIVVTYNSLAHTEDEGFEGVQSALIHDTQIKLFFCYQEPSALGVSKYITSNSDFDSSQYAAFTVGLRSAGRTAIENSKIESSILRGAIMYGVYSEKKQLSPSESVFIVARDILLGDAPSRSWWVPEDRWAVTGFGYNYLYDSPENDLLLTR